MGVCDFWGFFYGVLIAGFSLCPRRDFRALDYVAVLGAYVFGYLILGDLPPAIPSTPSSYLSAGPR